MASANPTDSYLQSQGYCCPVTCTKCRYIAVEWTEVELTTSQVASQCFNHYRYITQTTGG